MLLNKISISRVLHDSIFHNRKYLIRVFLAEALKQHRSLFGTWSTYCSLLVWPGLQLAISFYVFKPFSGSSHFMKNWPLAATPGGIFLFIVTGMLGYIAFWSLVQSSWQFSKERFEGTLELLFLTPVNRLILILANSIIALAQSAWLFLVFCIGLIILVGRLNMASPLMLLVAFFSLLIPAVAWGAFLNAFFIFSRDSSLISTVLDEPMAFLAGVNIPLMALPTWIRFIGALFPLTTSLIVIRGIFLEKATMIDILPQLAILLLFSLALLTLAHFILIKGEKRALHNGTLTLF